MFNLNTCPHCGCIHYGVCLRIKSIEYYPDGLIKKVEYHDPQPTVPIISAPPDSIGGYTIVVTPHENIQVII